MAAERSTSNERPEGVPEDWVHVGCANPACPYMVWVPRLTMPGQRVVNVCSIECITALLDRGDEH